MPPQGARPHNSHPDRALRRFCLDCQGGYAPSVQACADTDCPLYALRQGPGNSGEARSAAVPAMLPLTLPAAPADAAAATATDSSPRLIRRFCLGCAGSKKEVRACDAKESCPLWSFRFGVLPATFKRVMARRKTRRETLLLPGFR